MKQMLFLLLLLPMAGFSQEHKYGLLFNDSTQRKVSLPLKNLNLLGSPHTAYSVYSYVIRHDSVYYRVFEKYSRDSLPVFDFTKEELVLRTACTQCLTTCPTMEPCHRNSCRWSKHWFVRKPVADLRFRISDGIGNPKSPIRN